MVPERKKYGFRKPSGIRECRLLRGYDSQRLHELDIARIINPNVDVRAVADVKTDKPCVGIEVATVYGFDRKIFPDPDEEVGYGEIFRSCRVDSGLATFGLLH